MTDKKTEKVGWFRRLVANPPLFAAVWVLVSAVFVSVGVGLFDFRLGLIVFGLAAGAAGVWNLTQE